MASNPVFRRIDRDSSRGYAGFGGGDPATMSAQQLQDLYNRPSAGVVETGRVTVEDVIMKATALFAVLGVGALVGWYVIARSPSAGAVVVLGSIVVTLGLGIAIAVMRTISVPLIVIYAAGQGLVVGTVSRIYNELFNGIVLQAVLATLATFLGMLVAYHVGLIRVTDKFRRFMSMALLGYLLFAVANFLYGWLGHHPFGFGGTGPLGIVISVVAVGLAAATLALDFDSVDRAVAAGAPAKYAWLLAHGFVVTLVWLYLEFLRLLGRMRS